jgi:tripartite-type tricarboxylate transporter receptor subunit TctC
MRPTAKLLFLVAAIVAALLLAEWSAAAQAPGDRPPVSFAGKQIRLFIGFSPTGFGYDTYGRLLARHLGNHLPGRPNVVASNKPGAGSLNLANYIYNVAPRDGTEIAIVGRGVAADPMLNGNASNAMFDAAKLTWLGSMNNEVSGFYIRQPGPAATLKELLAGQNLKVGATGAGGDQQVFAATLNALLGTKLTTIGGYPGTNEILLAVERGELDGIVGYSWGVARSGNKDLLDSGKLKIILQLALAKHSELPTVPLVTEFEIARAPLETGAAGRAAGAADRALRAASCQRTRSFPTRSRRDCRSWRSDAQAFLYGAARLRMRSSSAKPPMN